MRIGIPSEIKDREHRVGATPANVRAFCRAGHQVSVQKDAGARIGFSDAAYQQAGAKIVARAEEIYQSEMIIKVKEPLPPEIPLLKKGQILFCYLHLAPEPVLTKQLLEKEVVGIAYETIVDEQGRLPLLTPMSEIAGRLSIQVGATYLQLSHGGKGVLLGGVPGVAPGRVVILGGGVSGVNAARMAIGLGADVVLIEKSLQRIRQLDDLYGSRLQLLFSDPDLIAEQVASADLVVGAVLVPGKLAPRLVTREMVESMEPGSVIVDIAIDQGGCVETARVTSHSDPVYQVAGVTHYCVPNMPGACAKTATQALTNATLPYALEIASLGYREALKKHAGLLPGLNVCLGSVTNSAVAQELGLPWAGPELFAK